MVSFWGKQLLIRATLMAVVGASLFTAVWLVSRSSGQATDGRKLPANVVDLPKPAEDRAALKLVQSAPSSTPLESTVRSISRSEAIAIAEKSVGGQAVKTEMRGDGATTEFSIDVLSKDGKTIRVSVDSTGSVTEKTELEPSSPERRAERKPRESRSEKPREGEDKKRRMERPPSKERSREPEDDD